MDPLISLLFILISLYFSVSPTIENTNILMDSVPEGFQLEKFQREIQSLKGVLEIHQFHLREFI